MHKGCTFTGEQATQKVLDMETDSNMENESEVYSDTVLCRDRPKRVYGQKHGHTDSSVAEKAAASDDSFEFQDDELQRSPQCNLQNLRSLRKHMRSGSPIPSTSTSTSKAPMRRTSTPNGSGEDMLSSPTSPVASTSSMPTHSWRCFWVWHPAVCIAETSPTHQYARVFSSWEKYTTVCVAQTCTPH